MFDPASLVRPNIRNLVPYSSARDEYTGRTGIFLDANENPFGTLNRYPDPRQSELKKIVSEIKGMPVENIFLGNGSDEIIDLCFRIFCTPSSDKALTFTPTYGMYGVSASVNDVDLITIPLDKNFQIDFSSVSPWLKDKQLKLIIICSPNNPTGNCIDSQTILKIASGFRGIVLIDEAYSDFSGKPSLASSVDTFPNLIVMQTFSKAYGLASARIGIAFASSKIIDYFNRVKAPYNISTINQKTVLRRIANRSYYKGQVRKIKSERERMRRELEKLTLVQKIWPSDANFLLVKVRDAEKTYNYLVDNGIIVRNRSSVVRNALRITIGTRKENDTLLKFLKEQDI
ncbi:MAG TPA: histidinol-phosphate transaminase [Bacteroidales bacterium]|nr:histidinol-phosphate transaminase [Bacteroidales bacterium]HPF04245.1 histidinol-phosphate transaminase [Bacteroidales bacterium]HPJ59669.1 histidinol-phosphate transaminase [Bacteroidales bacterium]HPR12515.1 histidinol-phosphate transaminase [Bacteroidales bacterium]HRW84914.1 histidinol-phosphate transaminase [Bacteroidales bacterium]